jgi:hypothetical protein
MHINIHAFVELDGGQKESFQEEIRKGSEEEIIIILPLLYFLRP